MNALQLLQGTIRMTRQGDLALSTVADANQDELLQLEAINDAAEEIALEYDDPSLKTVTTISIVVGTEAYTLPVDIVGEKIYALWINDSTTGVPDGTIDIVSYEDYVTAYDRNYIGGGRVPGYKGNMNGISDVVAYTLGGNLVFKYLPLKDNSTEPTTTHTVNMMYKAAPTYLADDSDTTGLSTLWDKALMYRAAMFHQMQVKQFDIAKLYEGLFDKARERAWKHVNAYQKKIRGEVPTKKWSGTW